MDRVYLDTSFFIGLIENQNNRQAEALKILEHERGNDRFTSQLTINEFMVRVYDDHKHEPDCDERVAAAEIQIRSIARVVAISDTISNRAAFLQSLYGEIHKHASPPNEPRDRKFRWDALHIATSWERKCDRIYAWDGKWEKLPEPLKEGLGEIIAPARLPGLLGLLQPPPEEGFAEPEPTADPSTEPPPPSEQSPSVPPASASLPEPSLPSGPLDGPEPQQQPEEDLPLEVPPQEPPSVSVPPPPGTQGS